MAQTATISAGRQPHTTWSAIGPSTVHKRPIGSVVAPASPTKSADLKRRAPGQKTTPGDNRASAEELLRHRETLPAADPERVRIRTVVIERNLAMAHRVARRYAGRGEPYEDLAQAAAMALVKAVDGYDTTREVPLTGYAIPSIVGSLKPAGSWPFGSPTN